MPASSTSATRPRRDLTPVIAEAYRDAALAGADMAKAVSALEATRRALADRRVGLRGLQQLDDHVGSADSPALRGVLARLRQEIFRLIRDEEVARLRDAFAAEPGHASREWLESYALALGNWRLELCHALVDEPFQLGGELPPLDAFTRWTQRMLHERWAEAYDLFCYLAAHEWLDEELRSQFLVHSAEIELYHFLDDTAAAALLERAEALEATALVDYGWGELLFEQGDHKAARARLERALERDPRSDAVFLLGDICEREGDLEAAESWYREGITRLSGQSSGYLRLARLYSTPERREEHGWRIPALLDTAIAAEPSSEYRCYLTMGEIEEQRGDFAAALEWYDRAASLDPTRIGAYVARGYALVTDGKHEEAEAAFDRAIAVAPEAFDGYWGVAWTCEQRGQYRRALECYAEALARRTRWKVRIQVRIAAAHKALGEYEQAATELLDALATAPNDADVLVDLHQLVIDSYELRRDRETAVDLLERIRKLRGPDYEADLQNRLGNVHFYLDEYAEAEIAYRRAVALQPDNGVYHRNLGGALRCLGRWEQALGELELALELDGDEESHRTSLALLLNDEANERFALGELDEARKLYEHALVHDPNDAVIHANLGNTWAGTWHPGERMRALEAATGAYRRAAEVDGSADAYRRELQMLEFERRLLELLGEPPVSGIRFPPAVLAIALGDDLVREAIDEATGGLDHPTRALVEETRERIAAEVGLTPSGIIFRRGEGLASDAYELYALERRLEAGTAADIEHVLAQLEKTLVATLTSTPTVAS